LHSSHIAYVEQVQRFFSSFPDGRAGVGLILLRVTVGASLVLHARISLVAPAWQMIAAGSLALLVALLLLIGFLTPVAGSFGAVIGLVNATATGLCFSLIAVAIVLLGPGAYSIDSRLFGRREIRF
jgi:uncharacterized membrane protein YphA (DoxX/SURF4 family)